MQKQILALVTAFILAFSSAYSQKQNQDSAFRRFFICSSHFMLANLDTDDRNAPDFVQLNFGYRLTPNNVISVEVKTWKYAWPLGIPYGKSMLAPEEKCPGYTRDFGIALVFQ